MAKQTPAQKRTVARVIHEFKQGELEKTGGEPVENPKQAIAIALHGAGTLHSDDQASHARNLRRTKRKEREGQTAQARHEAHSKAELYAVARKRDLPGRSTMTKDELARALVR